MFFLWVEINKCQPNTAPCAWGAERKTRRLAEDEVREGAAQAFTEYRCPLVIMSSFHYLGKTLTEMDDDWTAVVGNLIKYPPTMDATSKYPWAGRCRCTELGEILRGGHVGEPPFFGRCGRQPPVW